MGWRWASSDHHVELGVVVAAPFLPDTRVSCIVVPVGAHVDAKLGPDEEAVGESIKVVISLSWVIIGSPRDDEKCRSIR